MSAPAPSWMDDPERRLRFRLDRLAKMDELIDEALPKLTICRNEHSQFRVIEVDSNEVVFRAKGKTTDQIDQTVAYLLTRLPKKEETAMPSLSTAQLDALASIRDASGPGFISDSRPLKVLLDRKAIAGDPVQGYVLTDEGRRLLRANNMLDTPQTVVTLATPPLTVETAHQLAQALKAGVSNKLGHLSCGLDCPARQILDLIAEANPDVGRLIDIEVERANILARLAHKGE